MNWRQGVLAIAAGAGAAAYLSRHNQDRYSLRGRTVLITGGSRGLGLELAREFGSQGAQLVICARDAEELAKAGQDLASRGISVRTLPCDITDRSQVTELIEAAGPIDVLVNNAGIIQVGPLADMTLDDFEQAMSVIFWGTVYTTLAALPAMRARGQGRIVNITSVGGKVSIPHLLPYSCAKFATVAFSEGLRAELAGSAVKVVTIVPGLMRTGSHVAADFKGQHDKEYAWFSLGAASPLVSISAERAARAIVQSTRRGVPERTLSVPAGLLTAFHGLLPGLTADLMGLLNRFVLPGPSGSTAPAKRGLEAKREIDSRLFDAATRMGDQASARNNEPALNPL